MANLDRLLRGINPAGMLISNCTKLKLETGCSLTPPANLVRTTVALGLLPRSCVHVNQLSLSTFSHTNVEDFFFLF